MSKIGQLLEMITENKGMKEGLTWSFCLAHGLSECYFSGELREK